MSTQLKYTFAILVLGLIFLSSCRRTSGNSAGWETSDVAAIKKILNTHVKYDDSELFLITDEEFIRMGLTDNLLERRPLQTEGRTYGRPMLSDFTFTRISRDQQTSEYFIEFHLVKNAAAVHKLGSFELASDEGELIVFETLARNIGDFNADGTKFLLPVTTFPNNHYTALVFDVQLNANKTLFESVTLEQRIDLPEFPFDIGNLVNTRFVNGNFYLSAWNGAYRVDIESGTADKFSSHWAQDFFEYDDKIYATGVASEDMFFSTDNGVNWVRSGNGSQMMMVKVANDHVFSHQALGFPYKLVDANLQFVDNIYYNTSFPDDNAQYFDIGWFDEKWYVTILNEVHWLDGDIQTQ